MSSSAFFCDLVILHCLFPLHRKDFPCPHLQRQLKGVDGLADQCLAIFAAGAGALILKCVAEIVLGPGPVLREQRFRTNRQRLA